MGSHYSQICYEKRIEIGCLLRAGVRPCIIAEQLGLHRSTIYRELKRNGSQIGYIPTVIENRLKELRRRSLKLNQDPLLRKAVLSRLEEGWSPEQISGRLRLEAGKSLICHETIYRYVYSRYEVRNRWYQKLRKKRFYRLKRYERSSRVGICHRVSIAERPHEVNTRESFGHWEGDLMLFSRGQRVNMITLRERKSRFLIGIKNESRHTKNTIDHIIRVLKQTTRMVSSITFDGKEFAEHHRLYSGLNVKTYFCDPYKSYQKGSVENANGLLREYFPRTFPINELTQETINAKISQINERPMKCLGYRTPKEVFYEAQFIE